MGLMNIAETITTTDFTFPGQTALYHGKVRDVYTLSSNQFVMIATDRISAFDVILPRAIPYKGQVLNQLAAHFLETTADIIPNWLLATPDPNVAIGIKAEPFKIEMVIRGSLVGYSWRVYQTGERRICGEVMPDGLREFDRFPEPLITPSTKAVEGHDEDISHAEILARGLASTAEWKQLCEYTHALFARGQALAAERGLVLADTKYEFGKTTDGAIILIDEIHTPDSSRYFYKDSYETYIGGDKSEPPRHLSKEFVREWLMAGGFSGKSGQQIPAMTDEFVQLISDRYIELFEQLTCATFERGDATSFLQRIEQNVQNYIHVTSESTE
jgi:phosphoribosylaminoimidazole-succinocarboxamide synthase